MLGYINQSTRWGITRNKTREPHVVLLAQFLAQRSAHDDTANARGGGEVSLPRLSPGAGHAWGCHVSFLLLFLLFLFFFFPFSPYHSIDDRIGPVG